MTDPLVDRLETPQECEHFAKNVENRLPESARLARRKALELRAAEYGVATLAEQEAIQAVYAYERVLTEKNGKTTRAGRTWQMIKRHGIIESMERIVKRKDVTAGYEALRDMGMQDLAFEAIVCRHPSIFSEAAVRHSRERLAEWDNEA